MATPARASADQIACISNASPCSPVLKRGRCHIAAIGSPAARALASDAVSHRYWLEFVPHPTTAHSEFNTMMRQAPILYEYQLFCGLPAAEPKYEKYGAALSDKY